MNRIVLALSVFVIYAVTIVAPNAMAAVKPVPKHPGHYQIVAKTAQEHKAAAANATKYAAYLRGMAEHHKSMAAEYMKAGNPKMAKHHMAVSKNQAASAKEYIAMEKEHKKSMMEKKK